MLHWWLDNILREDDHRARRESVPGLLAAIKRASTNKLFAYDTTMSPSQLMRFANMDIDINFNIFAS